MLTDFVTRSKSQRLENQPKDLFLSWLEQFFANRWVRHDIDLIHWFSEVFPWEVSSVFESLRLLAWQAENSTSGWGSFWERSPLGSWFSTSAFRNVLGTVPENVRTCGFKRNSSKLDRAPKMRDSVLLQSWDNFLVTLPSTFSENFAIHSSVIPGPDEFCDWLFLGYSCVLLDTTANFRLFLNVAIFGEKVNSGETELFVFLGQILSTTKLKLFFLWRNSFPINNSQMSRIKVFNVVCTVL